jgi:pimeloyl-ACP methyl ester carboxylesterase
MAAELRDAGPALHVEELGEGEPALLLLTGWCSSHERWALAAPLLAAHRRVVLFDWRGHGDSAPAQMDFGTAQLVQDAMAVIEERGLQSVIPCSASHSGWVAIELRRRLGERVPAIAHLDWMVNRPSGPYMELIAALQSEDTWQQARDKLFEIWAADDRSPAITGALEVMRRQGAEMWIRSGREIEAEYARDHSPLEAYAAIDTPPQVLHIYGQPPAQEYLASQRTFAQKHDWFAVHKLEGHTHFSMIECPSEITAAIETLAVSVSAP